jgi:chitin disaccharide deacetylase
LFLKLFFLKKIIVNGDDFGISSEVNEAVERDFVAGLLTRTGLMVTGEKVDEACRIAKRNPGLKIGLHLVLCAGRAVRPSVFTDRSGNLIENPFVAGIRYVIDRRAQDWLRTEIFLQSQRFSQLGFPSIHWDGHCHLHMHPILFRIACEVLSSFRSVRLVYECIPRTLIGAIFNVLSRSVKPTLDRLRIQYPDQVLGLEYTGRMGTDAFIQCLDRVGEDGVTEIYYHPGMEKIRLNTAKVLAEIECRQILLSNFS